MKVPNFTATYAVAFLETVIFENVQYKRGKMYTFEISTESNNPADLFDEAYNDVCTRFKGVEVSDPIILTCNRK